MEHMNTEKMLEQLQNKTTPIYNSCSSRNLKLLRALIRDGEDVNHLDVDGCSYLMSFITDFEICKILVSHGINIGIKDAKGQTALHYAAKQAESSTVKLLLSKGAGINDVDNLGKTTLHHVLDSLALKVTEGLGKLGLSGNDETYAWIYNRRKRKEKELWEIEMFMERFKIMTWMIDDVNWRNILEHAVRKSAMDIVRYLAHKGLDVNIQDTLGRTALHYAVERNYSETVKMLIHCVSDVNLKDCDGKTVLHVAAAEILPEMLNLLLDHGATIDVTDNLKRTPLHYSVQLPWLIKELHCCEILIERGADVTAKDDNLKSVVHHAVEHSCLGCISSLIKNGASLSDKDASGFDPTVYAAVKNKNVCVEYLVQNHAEIVPVQSQIDAYELIASFALTKELNIFSGKKYLKKAMKIRNENNVAGKNRTILNDIFSHEDTEPQTMMSIICMDGWFGSMILQGAFIQSRILGPYSETVFSTLKMLFTGQEDKVMVYLNSFANLKFKKHLFETIFTLFGESDTRCLDATRQVAEAYSLVLPHQLLFPDFFKDITIFFDQIFSTCSRSIIDNKKESYFEITKVASYVLYLLFEMSRNADEEAQVQELVRKLIVIHSVLKKHGKVKKSLPLLIMLAICGNVKKRKQKYYSKGMLQFIRTLVNFGITFETVSKKQDSVLHYLLMFVNYKVNMNNMGDINETVRLIIDNGAHVDLRNEDGLNTLSMMQNIGWGYARSELDVCPVRDRTLQCLAAEVIMKNKVPYRKIVPMHMVSFINMHG